MITRYITEDII